MVDEHYQVSKEELAHSEGYEAVCQNIWQPDWDAAKHSVQKGKKNKLQNNLKFELLPKAFNWAYMLRGIHAKLPRAVLLRHHACLLWLEGIFFFFFSPIIWLYLSPVMHGQTKHELTEVIFFIHSYDSFEGFPSTFLSTCTFCSKKGDRKTAGFEYNHLICKKSFHAHSVVFDLCEKEWTHKTGRWKHVCPITCDLVNVEDS